MKSLTEGDGHKYFDCGVITDYYLLEKTIHYLKAAGINDIILVVNHQQDLIRNVFEGGQIHGVNIEYIVQKLEDPDVINKAISVLENEVVDETQSSDLEEALNESIKRLEILQFECA